MTKTTTEKSKSPVLRDIRVYPFFPLKIFPHQNLFSRIAFRFVCKLKEDKFSLGPFHHVYIHVAQTDDAASPLNDAESWMKNVFVLLRDDLQRLSEPEAHDYFVNVVADVLNRLAEESGADAARINLVRQSMLNEKDDLEIQFADKQTKQYCIRIYYKLKDLHPHQAQVYVRLTDANSGRRGNWLLCEVSYDEMHALIGSIVIAGDKLVVRPKTSETANREVRRYQNRGFDVPIEVDLDRIFESGIEG